VTHALTYGVLAAGSLLVGALLGIWRSWSPRVIGLILAFGAGALISAVAFELAEEGLAVGGAAPVAIGLALGALTFFLADRAVERWGARADDSLAGSAGSGMPLALGALLDGIPEQVVLGIGLAAGGEVGLALLVAIILSNLPEAIGAAADLREAGRSRGFVVGLWAGVAALCAAATMVGYLSADRAGGAVTAGIDGFAAGALLVMIVDSMVPEAREKGGDTAGLATVAGFALAAGLSLLS